MEKLNGGVKLPPGFRFHPTDEELILHYLKRKVFSFPLPYSIIPEFHVSKSDPWDFPGNLSDERYFFSIREAKYPNGNRSNRATSSGYWKATGLDKQIVDSKRNQIVGMKKTLVFYQGKPPHECRTDWIMHEYRLVSSELTACNSSQGKATTPEKFAVGMEDWVICRISLKKRQTKNDGHNIAQKIKMGRLMYYDFMTKNKNVLNLSSSSSSSDLSGITEVSCNEQLEYHQTSSCNSLSCFSRQP